MKLQHFELAICDITINNKNRDAVKQVLVEGRQITEVARAIGMNQSQLSKQVRRVLNGFQEYLQKRDLIANEWIIDKEMYPMLEALESKCLEASYYRIPPRKRRKKS